MRKEMEKQAPLVKESIGILINTYEKDIAQYPF
jgi:hypothetical protein